jgi:hypothetical protein
MSGSAAKPASTVSILSKYPDIVERLPPLREPLEHGLAISYTLWEAWLALYHGKVLLIAKADEAAPHGPHFAPTPASRAAQALHRDSRTETRVGSPLPRGADKDVRWGPPDACVRDRVARLYG